MNKSEFLDCINKSNKLELLLNTRDARVIGAVVSFLEAKKYGRVKSSLSTYGLLYLVIPLSRQKKAFFEDVFAQNPYVQLAKIVNIDYVEMKCHVPERELCGSNK